MDTNKKMFFAVLLIVVLALGLFGWASSVKQQIKSAGSNQAKALRPEAFADYRNIAYTFDGRSVQLVNGTADELAAPGSASRITTTFFGNEMTADLNKDGRPDVVFYITQSTGGSGMFYYVVAALNTEKGYVGSSAYFVGDRIAPQTINTDENGIVLINYADRKKGQPFSAQPSEGKTLRLRFVPSLMKFSPLSPQTKNASRHFLFSYAPRYNRRVSS